jgi:hypothetical protein
MCQGTQQDAFEFEDDELADDDEAMATAASGVSETSE